MRKNLLLAAVFAATLGCASSYEIHTYTGEKIVAADTPKLINGHYHFTDVDGKSRAISFDDVQMID